MRATVEVCNELGLHVRPAGLLAELARRFRSELTLAANGESVDARSIMGLMTLGLPQGSTVEIMADGDDEQAALAALVDLFARGFDEK